VAQTLAVERGNAGVKKSPKSARHMKMMALAQVADLRRHGASWSIPQGNETNAK
jgi:hypothetical protein